jgi:hypothetical protein
MYSFHAVFVDAINTSFDPDAVLTYANDAETNSSSNVKSNVEGSTAAANDDSAVTSQATSHSASKLPTLQLLRMNSSVLDIHSDGFADDSALDEHADTIGSATTATARNLSILERRQMVQQLFEAIDACDAMRVRELLHRGCEVNTVWLPQSTTAVIDDATNAR